jgi:CDP-diacylglycerol--serine O-phosphatidyltransferase
MSAVEQSEINFSSGGIANHRRRRGIFLLPGMLTVANMLCGYYAILAVLSGSVSNLDNASRAIGLAILFDSFDGFVARATRTSSEFGKQFDSLADVISFGIAPAFLAFAWGVRGVTPPSAGVAEHIRSMGWWVSFAFVLCAAWRLARFNVHGMAPGGMRYFVGMPTPAAAGMIAAVVHAWKDPLEDWRWSLGWLALVVALAALMTSAVRHYSFKDLPWTRRLPSLTVVLVGLLVVWSIVVYSEVALFLIATSYALSGITLHVIRLVRHRLASHPAPSA